ncbi:hypothetical protein [Pseudomonas sp. 18175]|uniref:hypothetical protein n=1 Tax=Pseudomonas sp. 18175 TaxID=3390056 RepID=UPI003D1A46AE
MRTKRGLPGFKSGSSALPRSFSLNNLGKPATMPVLPKSKSLPNLAISHPPSGATVADKFKNLAKKIQAQHSAASGTVVLAKPVVKVTVADTARRLMDAQRLVKAGVFPTAPSAGLVARDAFISAGITGLVTAPFNVGAHAGAVAVQERIKASYVPAALPPAHLPGAAATTPAVSSTDTASPTPRLDRAEKTVWGIAEGLLTVVSGSTDTPLGIDEKWPKQKGSRLDNLEKMLTVSEQMMTNLAKEHGIVFTPYEPSPEQAASGKEGIRVEVVEQRCRAIETAVERLLLLKGAENAAKTRSKKT